MLKHVLGLVLGLGLGATAALAQDYPSKPITLLLPVAPGGANDTFARVFAQRMEAELGQPMVIENKPGAGGIVGLEDLASRPQDGYTLFLGHITSSFLTPLYNPDKLSFDWRTDLKPLTNLIYFPTAVIVRQAIGAKTLEEVVAYGKANPDQLRFSTGGRGTQSYWDMRRFELATGVKFNDISFAAGGAPTNQAFLAGDLDLAFHSLGSARPLLEQGDVVTLLGVAGSSTRLAEFPEAPTLDELGFPGVGSALWIGLYGFGDFPQEATDKIVAASTKVLGEMRDELAAQSIIANPNSPAEFAAFLAAEEAAYNAMIEQLPEDMR